MLVPLLAVSMLTQYSVVSVLPARWNYATATAGRHLSRLYGFRLSSSEFYCSRVWRNYCDNIVKKSAVIFIPIVDFFSCKFSEVFWVKWFSFLMDWLSLFPGGKSLHCTAAAVGDDYVKALSRMTVGNSPGMTTHI